MVDDQVESSTFDEHTEQALVAFQRANGLAVDGTLNAETLALMRRPRCGFPDGASSTSTAFVAQGNKWPNASLTYSYSNLTADLTSGSAKAAIRASFDRWAGATPLTFAETTATGDILIGWYAGDHGDGSSFDGPGAVLAHAFYPPPNGGDIAGDVHLDAAETWSIDTPPSGIDLRTVSLHELGHALGLAHSSVSSAVMYAYYGGPRRELTADDIQGIQSIYGVNLALGKAATQSSTLGTAAASRAVDGNIDGNWYNDSVTHTDFNAQAWWQVDLGTVTAIGDVVIYNRTDCCSERLADFDIQLSSDGTSWQTAASFAGPAPARTTLAIRRSGRFVRVRLRGTDYLSLAEVQVFAAQDLALGKAATQSSTLGTAAASRAVDGNIDGNWYNGSVTHTDFNAQAWWQVDLGAVTAIGDVVIYNRTDCCSERLADFDIQLSNDGTSWQTAASFAGPAPVRTALSIQASGRFVRVRLRGTDYLSLAEVQVFAP